MKRSKFRSVSNKVKAKVLLPAFAEAANPNHVDGLRRFAFAHNHEPADAVSIMIRKMRAQLNI